MLEKKLKLYFTEACHLCENAKAVFYRVAEKQRAVDVVDWQLELVDIANDEALFEKYGVSIPVMEACGQELFWPFDEAQLDQFLISIN